MALLLLKHERTVHPITIDVWEPANDEFSGVRCPLCGWRPETSSLWSCSAYGTPEPDFVGCGAIWNTFATRGCCPGCTHQWLWTSCLRCDGWSLHEDWYVAEETGR